jgi:hypothetical protein
MTSVCLMEIYFNQDISSWDVSKVTSLGDMFSCVFYQEANF